MYYYSFLLHHSAFVVSNKLRVIEVKIKANTVNILSIQK